MAVYDTIGTTYTTTRRPDPRIAARVAAAIGDAPTVADIGAGAGSYEPPATVLAVEPSAAMLAQRPPVRRRPCGRSPRPSRCGTGRSTRSWRS